VKWDCRIEHWDREFENAPKQIVAILGLNTDRRELGVYLGIGCGKEPREQFKERNSTFMIAFRSETRHKQTFEIIPQAYSIKRHEWD
jgi:hypothetical protein